MSPPLCEPSRALTAVHAYGALRRIRMIAKVTMQRHGRGRRSPAGSPSAFPAADQRDMKFGWNTTPVCLDVDREQIKEGPHSEEVRQVV